MAGLGYSGATLEIVSPHSCPRLLGTCGVGWLVGWFHGKVPLRNDNHVSIESEEFSGERGRRGWQVGGPEVSQDCPSRACPGSRAGQEALKCIAQEWRRLRGSGGRGRGLILATLSCLSFHPHSPETWGQMWTLQTPLLTGRQETMPMD